MYAYLAGMNRYPLHRKGFDVKLWSALSNRSISVSCVKPNQYLLAVEVVLHVGQIIAVIYVGLIQRVSSNQKFQLKFKKIISIVVSHYA